MRDYAPLLAVAALVALLFLSFPSVFTGETLLFNRELRYLHYPYFRYAVDEFRQERVPLWTDRVFCGYPVIANIQLGLLYPLNLYFLAGSVPARMTALVLLHFLAGGIGMYTFTRRLGFGFWGALAAACVFMLNGFAVSKYVEFQSVRTMCWLPLVLLFVSRAREHPEELLCAGLLHGISLLGGMIQYWYYQSFFVGAWAVYEWARGGCDRGTSGTKDRKLRGTDATDRGGMCQVGRVAMGFLVGATVFLIAIGIGAIQLAPAFELSREAERSSLGYADAVAGEGNNLSARELIESVLPDGFGRAGAFVPTFLGLLAIALAIAGIGGWRETAFFWGSVVFFGLVAAGRYTPFYRLLYEAGLPGFRMFHDPIRAFSGMGFAIAVLAGFGLDRLALRRTVQTAAGVWILLVAAALLTGASLWCNSLWIALVQTAVLVAASFLAESHAGMVRGLLCAAIALALAFEARNLVQTASRAEVARALSWELPRELKSGRLFDMETDDLVLLRWLPVGVADVTGFSALAPRGLLRLSGAHLDRIDPIRHNLYQELVSDRKLLALTGARHVICRRGTRQAAQLAAMPHLRARPAPRGIIEGEDARNYMIFELPEARPRIWSVSSARREEDALKTLTSGGVDIAREVVVPYETGFLPHSDSRGTTPSPPVVLFSSPQRTVSKLTEGRLFVLNDAYYPGWRAFSDGRETAILRADYCFRAVPAERSLDLAYDPRSFRLGLFVTLATLALLGLVAGALCMRRSGS